MLKLIQWPPATSISLHDLIQWNTNEFDFHLLSAGVWMEREYDMVVSLSIPWWIQHQKNHNFLLLVGKYVGGLLVKFLTFRIKL